MAKKMSCAARTPELAHTPLKAAIVARAYVSYSLNSLMGDYIVTTIGVC